MKKHILLLTTGGTIASMPGGEGLFLATLTGPGEVWLQSLPFSRMADEIIKASRSNNKEENSGINNPLNEVTGGLSGALGGLFKI